MNIITKYHGLTNKRGSRVVATREGKRVAVVYDDGLSARKNHENALRALVHCDPGAYGTQRWVGGDHIGSTMVWVRLIEEDVVTIVAVEAP